MNFKMLLSNRNNVLLISILFLCITDKKLQSEYIISLIGVWKGVNKSYSTEKGSHMGSHWESTNNHGGNFLERGKKISRNSY